MNKTGIEWADYTWNPVTGCTRGCSYCYARRMAQRLRGRAGYPQDDPFRPTFHPNRLEEPFSAPIGSKIFVCSMGELLCPDVPDEDVEAIRNVVRHSQSRTFIFLTKNPHLLAKWNPWPSNAWVGATATDHVALALAEQSMKAVDAPVRFISAEPLLANLMVGGLGGRLDYLIENGTFQWLIIGAQTGPGARENQPKREWVEQLVAAAVHAGIPVFEKNNLAPILGRPLRQEVPHV